MIPILDKYIIRKYLSTFFFSALLISMVAVVIDLAENVHKFLKVSLSLSEVLFGYYLPFIPWVNGLLWPLIALVSVIFFTSRMASDSEIISILNAGVSYNRILVPYLIGASLIAGILWVGINYLIPISNEAKTTFEDEHKLKVREQTHSSDTHFFISPDSKIFTRHYRKRDTSITTFRLETFDDKGRLIKLIKADRVEFKEPPHTWSLKDYSVRTLNENNESLLVAAGETLDTSLNFKPGDFTLNTKQMEIMTTKDLRQYIQREEERGIDNTKKYYIELQRRTADPFTIIILTLIGVAIASRKVRGGTGMHLASGIVVGSAFVLLSKFTVTFAHNLSLSPSLGVWIPNIVFMTIALAYILKAQK